MQSKILDSHQDISTHSAVYITSFKSQDSSKELSLFTGCGLDECGHNGQHDTKTQLKLNQEKTKDQRYLHKTNGNAIKRILRQLTRVVRFMLVEDCQMMSTRLQSSAVLYFKCQGRCNGRRKQIVSMSEYIGPRITYTIDGSNMAR